MYRKAITIAALLLAVSFTGFGWSALAQAVTGRISGTVVDGSGAAVPGASVKITNTNTDISRTVMTDPNGFYVATSLAVGNYSVTVERQGFKRSTKTGYNLGADNRLTVDFSLETGNLSESVEIVATTGETVNTTSGEVARVVDQKQVQELALNGRNYLQLTTLIPGVPLLPGNDDQLGLTTSLSVAQSVNGSRTNANLLTVDGGFNLDSGSNNSQINNVGIDFIREVSIKTASFSAEYGRNSGASINIVTRSGENTYHGSAFEFLRNDKLDANNFFNNANGVARPTLRFNDFGFAVGGPIIKDKLFFFGGSEFKYIRRFATSVLRTLPTRAERNGDFSLRLAGPDGIVGTADDGVLRDPRQPSNTCVAPTISGGVVTKAAVRTGCFPNNTIPANLLTADGKAIANVYNAMEKIAASYKDVLTSNNSIFQPANPFDNREDLVRIDYRFNERHAVYGRYLHDKFDLIDPFGTFINSQLPTIPTNRLRPGYSVQLGHTWLITPSLINEARLTGSWNGQRIPPVGEFWKRDTYGFTFQQVYLGGGRFENSIPDVTISNFSSFNGASNSLLSPTTDIALSDNLTWTHGSHTLKTGLLLIRNRKDQNGRTTYPGVVSFSASGNPNTTGNAFADALLGNFRTYSEAANDPIGFFRFSSIEGFVSDNWKVNRRLSLEMGLRYQYGFPTYTQANNIANFDPAFYDPAKAVTVKPDGTIDTTKGGNRFNGLVRVGAGVPTDELGRVPGGNSPLVLSVPTGAPRGVYQPQGLFAPRFSFAYSMDDKTAIRGGFGIYYDKPEGNLIFSQVNLPPYSISSQFENGNLGNVAGAAASALAPFGNINAIDPNLVVPYQMNFTLSVQRELPWGIFGEAAYVGNLGRHLIRQPDINQPTFAALVANAALPSAQRLSTNALRPYKGFSQILMRLSDSNSNYNALQLYVTKRRGNVTMSVSYTWSKALADTSGNGDNPEDPFNRSFNYGPADFDRRQVFVTTYTYSIPFFRSLTGAAGKALSGWEVSGITRWQTGHLITPTGNTSIGGRRADYVGGDISQQGSNPLTQWFNTAAFAPAPDTRRGTAGEGIIEGPGRYLWDLSLRKYFALRERIRLQFQGDFFNAFNWVNLNDPGTNINGSGYGGITGAAPGRNIQFGLKLTF
jgi:hypothetical protein